MIVAGTAKSNVKRFGKPAITEKQFMKLCGIAVPEVLPGQTAA
jgi:hypothetical protein